MREAVRMLSNESRRLVNNHGGAEVKLQDWLTMVTFSSALDAVQWCLALQSGLLALPWPRELLARPECAEEKGPDGTLLYRGLCVRMAVGLGVVETDLDLASGTSGYISPFLSRLLRVHQLTNTGQVVLLDAVWDRVKHAMDGGDVEVVDLGKHVIRDDESEEHLWEVLPKQLVGRCTFQRYNRLRTHTLARGEYWRINYADVSLLDRVLSSTPFGETVEGRWKGSKVAVYRLYSKRLQELPESSYLDFYTEVHIRLHVRHPNINAFIGACLEPESFIVTELCGRGSLHSVIHNHSIPLNWGARVELLRGVVAGMHYLHSLDPAILLVNLSTHGVLVTENLTAKLGDFSHALMKSATYSPMHYNFDSNVWVPPEIVLGQEVVDESVDIYNFGLVMIEVLCRAAPFAPPQNGSLNLPRASHTLDLALDIIGGRRPTIPPNIGEPYSSLLQRCWAEDKQKRPPFSEILSILNQTPLNLGNGMVSPRDHTAV
eukprot:Colp12_sorted_trinity150504_noHs@17395